MTIASIVDFAARAALQKTEVELSALCGFLGCVIKTCLRQALTVLVWAGCVQVAVADSAFNSIAFGSCNHSHLPQPMWSVIDSHQPDVFIWAGDVVYADTVSVPEMRNKYQQQLSRSEYRDFIKSTPVIGTWDDHDYGTNDGGKNNPIKPAAQQVFLDFLNEPLHSDRRKQQGVFASYIYGEGNNTVKVFLLDTRYHRDRPGVGRADILGRSQWAWLENEIKHSTAAINLIVSSVSVLSQQVPFAEEWNDFKWARKRLFALIDYYQLPGVLFLTGDRHFAAHVKEEVSGRLFHEFMSSGLTHYMKRKRVTQVFRYYYGRQSSYFGLNFGLLDIHWDRDPLQLTFSVFDESNTKQLGKVLYLKGRYWRD